MTVDLRVHRLSVFLSDVLKLRPLLLQTKVYDF